jgi:polyisoprenoid-binding protein YceI
VFSPGDGAMRRIAGYLGGTVALAAVLATACGGGGTVRTPPGYAGSSAAATPAAPGTASTQDAAGAPVSGTFTIGPGSTASYTAHETFLRQNSPFSPVGKTSGVGGTLVLQRGVFAPSTVTVDLTGLQTDQPMRDRRVQQALETARYPRASFTVTGEEPGAPPVVAGGTVQVRLSGDLTIHGVTRPEVWAARVSVSGRTLHLVATLQVQMTDFGVEPPNIAGFVAVQPTVQLGADLTAKAG